jgi:anti-sigma B factor antagonist
MHVISKGLNVVVLRPASHHLSAASALEFERNLLATMSEGRGSQVILNLGAVDSIDNDGLNTLLSALKLAQRYDCCLQLCSVSPALRIIFEISQVDRLCKILDGEDLPQAA